MGSRSHRRYLYVDNQAHHTFDGTIIFAGEYYQPGKEIWQHGPAIKRMTDFNRIETVFADPTIYHTTAQQSQKPGEAIQRAKSFGELYYEQGIEKFIPFGGDRSDVSFAGRLQMHWADLENREPTVKIVCRRYSETPQFGMHNWDCPNLLWEMMRCRRVKLTAQQLLSRNVSEAIVGKDNHAIDAAKYVIMSHPEPSQKPLERRVNERVAAMQKVDPTTAVANYFKILQQERDEEDDEPSYYGGSARRLIRRMERQHGWRR